MLVGEIDRSKPQGDPERFKLVRNAEILPHLTRWQFQLMEEVQ
jgi:hypothetical protein